MPKDSCINHPSRGDFIILRRHMVDLCRGDHCAAAVLAYFEHHTNVELDRFSKAGVERPPWVWVTATLKSIAEGTVGLYSERRIRDRIDWLESIGILRVVRRDGGANSYLLNFDLINEHIKTEKPLPDAIR